MSLVSAPFWHAAGTTSLEGFECSGTEQRERRSGDVSAYPSVTVNPRGSLSDRARNGHEAERVEACALTGSKVSSRL